MRRCHGAPHTLPLLLAFALSTWSLDSARAQCFTRIQSAGVGGGFGGYAVEVDGNLAAISGSSETRVYELDDGVWSPAGRIGARGARISGERVVTGRRGSVPAVWVRNGTSWVLEGNLRAPSTGASYGQYFAISGNYAAVSEHDASKVDVFEHDGSAWRWVQTLRGARLFGWTIDMDEDRLVVGTPTQTGEVTVFRRVNGEWVFEAQLLQPEDGTCVFFGTDVSISVDTIAVGTSPDYSSVQSLCGRMYVFERDDDSGAWEHTATMSSPSNLVSQRYSRQIDLAGDNLVTTTFAYPGEGGTGSGFVFLYRRVAGEWIDLGQFVPAEIESTDHFGVMVATNARGQVLIGAGSDNANGNGAGAVYALSLGPVVEMSGLDAEVQVGVEVSLSATRHGVDPLTDDADFVWSLGDGTVLEGREVAHTWTEPGVYEISISATDGDGACSQAEARVVVACPAAELGAWSSADVGEPVFPGAGSLVASDDDGDDIEVCAGGEEFPTRSTAEELHFVHREVEGDFVLRARMSDWIDWSSNQSAGLAIRESLDPSSPHVSLLVTRFAFGSTEEARLSLIFRDTAGERSDVERFDLDTPDGEVWLELRRAGAAFRARASADGATWEEVATVTVDLGPSALVGVGANARHRDRSAPLTPAMRLTFRDVSIGDGEIRFVRGDTNADGVKDLSDAVRVLGFLFLGDPAPTCLDSADTDDNGALELSDGVSLLNHLFLGAPAPSAPTTECGVDPSDDELSCEAFDRCE